MKLTDKKLIILDALQQHGDYIRLPDLMKMLDASFKERSPRRWLNEMVADHRVEKIGQKRVTCYRAKLKNNETSIAKESKFIIRHIILDLLTGNTMFKYIEDQTNKIIPEVYRAEFINIVKEDLVNIGPERIAGMLPEPIPWFTR